MLFLSSHSQTLLIFPSSAQMCVPQEIAGSLPDTFSLVPTSEWVVTTTFELTQEFVCS